MKGLGYISTPSPIQISLAEQALELGIRKNSLVIEMDVIPIVCVLDLISITQPMSINDSDFARYHAGITDICTTSFYFI